MRALPLLLVILIVGCETKPESHSPVADPVRKALGVGDPAPPLKVTQWLKGAPVTIQPGTVYVIDFWAIWCPPCIRSLPHLGELASEFGPKGVEFVAITRLDEQGSVLSSVKKYLDTFGKNYDLHFGWCEDDATVAAWMGAANRSTIPCSFVIDKTGAIAFIGEPHELDDVLPKVIDGTWQSERDLKAMAVREARLKAIFNQVRLARSDAAEQLWPNAEESVRNKVMDEATANAAPKALEELAAFAKDYPRRAGDVGVRMQTMVLAMRAGRYDEAKTIADAILSRCQKTHNTPYVEDVRDHWLDRTLNPDRKHPEVAIAVAELLLEMRGPKDLEAVLSAAEAYSAAGNQEKYQAMAATARMLTENDPDLRKRLEEKLKSFEKK